MKELVVAALYSMEEVLQSPNAFQKNMKITCEKVTHKEPRALYMHYQLKANQTPIRMDKSNAWRSVAQDIEISTAKEAAATTSKLKEVQPNNPEENMYHYNRKGFLEDDDCSDDSIFIVDLGWDDYCLQELKLNRPVLLCPEARRARM
ncbi:hypothetical protein Tco_1205586 [Tanacetum coccineum]